MRAPEPRGLAPTAISALVLLATACINAASPSSASLPSASLAPRTGTLLITSSGSTGDPSSPSHLIVLDADGGHPRELAAGDDGSWSPDGHRVAYTHQNGGGPWVVNADGTHAAAIPAPSFLGVPGIQKVACMAWSPDSRKLAYEAWVGADSEMGQTYLIVATIGGAQRKIDDGDLFGPCPTWSPDGRWITIEREGTGGFELDRVPAGDGQIIQVTHVPDDTPCVVWSPAGDRIAYVTGLVPTTLSVFTLEGRVLVNQPIGEGGGPGMDGCPSWSPDGRKLVFTGKGGDFGLEDLYVVGADGSGLQRLTSGADASGPVWSPDGTLIAFESSFGELCSIDSGCASDVWVMNASGGGLTKIASGSHPRWKPTG